MRLNHTPKGIYRFSFLHTSYKPELLSFNCKDFRSLAIRYMLNRTAREVQEIEQLEILFEDEFSWKANIYFKDFINKYTTLIVEKLQ